MEKHWRHKNAKEWTEEEITQLIIDVIGKDVVRPVGDNLLVELCEKEKMTKGGIILVDTKQDKFYSRIGRVLAMGSYAYKTERFNLGAFCHIGDYIQFRQFEWEDVPVEGKDKQDFIYVPCNRVTGVVKDKADVILQ